ncbi:OmpH family outer membrane protein [Pseudomethylobacillus aquaticus]|uniref:OmpH family outer membrane protein n=1 Tax=Pseudomethylobacillus aquaticus TaxID=2676064 RepID=UPI001F01B37B|nr:OmpH family outer membrane protein [Pseudomethylobacillus aquaticus]
MKKWLTLTMLLGSCLLCAQAYAATKIGYIQLVKIMQSPQADESGKLLLKEFSGRQAALEKLKKEIDAKEAALTKESAKLAKADFDKRTEALNNQKVDYNRKQRELAEDFELRKEQERNKLQDRVNKAVESIAKAEGYDLVLYGTAAYVGKKGVDITDKALKALPK